MLDNMIDSLKEQEHTLDNILHSLKKYILALTIRDNMLSSMKEPELIMDPIQPIIKSHILVNIQNSMKEQEHSQGNTIVHQNNFQDSS